MTSGSLIARVVLGAALAACASTTMRTADYDRSCTKDSDCVAVFEGDLCDVCCNDGAINKRDEQRYEQDLEHARDACGEKIMQCEPCMGASATCQRGRCLVSDGPPAPETERATSCAPDRAAPRAHAPREARADPH